jgi:hypothetical protein
MMPSDIATLAPMLCSSVYIEILGDCEASWHCIRLRTAWRQSYESTEKIANGAQLPDRLSFNDLGQAIQEVVQNIIMQKNS